MLQVYVGHLHRNLQFCTKCTSKLGKETWEDIALLFTHGDDIRGDFEYGAFYSFINWLKENNYKIEQK